MTADQDHVADIGVAHARVFHRDLARLDGACDQFLYQAFQLGAGDLYRQMLRAARVCGNIRQVHFGLLCRRKFDLGFFRRVLQALQRQHVFLQVDAAFLLEFVDQIFDHAHVEVFAAKESITIGGQHLELMLAIYFSDVDDGDVERTAAQVIHRDLAVAFLFVQAECQRGRSRLIDDALDFQTGDATGVLGCLALRVVEISRHGDDCLSDGFAQIVLGGLFHLHQYLCGYFRCGEFLVAHFHPRIAVLCLDDAERHHCDVLLHHLFVETATDQTLDAIQRILRVGHGLTFGGRTHQHFAVFHVSDDGWRGARAFRIFNDLGLAVFHDGHARVRRAQVDTDDLSHDISFRKWLNPINLLPPN